MRRLVGAIAVAGVLLAGCSSTGTTGSSGGNAAAPTSAAVPAASLGKPATFEWMDDSAGQITIHTMKWQKKGKGNYAPAPENGAYLVMDVTVESTKGTVSPNPLYFAAIDKDGRKYDGLGSMSGWEPSLDSSDLAAGKKRRGYIAIDMPQAAGTIEFQAPLGETLIEWKLPAK